jgi:hypothetical protein
MVVAVNPNIYLKLTQDGEDSFCILHELLNFVKYIENSFVLRVVSLLAGVKLLLNEMMILSIRNSILFKFAHVHTFTRVVSSCALVQFTTIIICHTLGFLLVRSYRDSSLCCIRTSYKFISYETFTLIVFRNRGVFAGIFFNIVKIFDLWSI